MQRALAPLLFLLLSTAFGAAAPASAHRVDDILARMTLDEKVGQLVMTGFDQALGSDILERGGAGSVISFNDAAAIARAQATALKSRLGIPLLVGLDLLHGFRTLFPVPIAEAASFDPALAERNAKLAAREATRAGLNWTFAPMADIGRDARWGRIVEGSGEDVVLARDFVAGRVRGFRAGGLAPTLKHFAAYGAVAGGRDYDAVSVSDDELRNIHFPPFEAALGPGTAVMTALTVLNGQPATASPLIASVLRGEWKFEGVVVSDWKAILGLIDQGFAEDGPDAARKALHAGVDIDMMSDLYARHLANEVRSGRVSMADLDAAVRRVLTLKIDLGLFDVQPADPTKAETAVLTQEMREAARDTVRKSVVLLKNERDVLPMGSTVKTIAVIGPFADNAYDQLGPHEARGRPEDAVTLLQGIRKRAERQNAKVLYARGCDADCESSEAFGEAIQTARSADLVVLALGEKREHSGEGASRASLDFPGKQIELLQALAATGKPVVLVVVAGRPLDLRAATSSASSILMAWYPGTEGGTGLADLLFGDASPSAKLPISWPRSVGQTPVHYDRLATGRPYAENGRYTMRFLDEQAMPLYPFGHGLTYSQFAYSGLVVAAVQTSTDIHAAVTISNTGSREATEIAQLYIRDEVATRVRPNRELKAYRRVTLKPGERRTVDFTLKRADLSLRNDAGEFIVEPGRFRIGIGANSAVELTSQFVLVD